MDFQYKPEVTKPKGLPVWFQAFVTLQNNKNDARFAKSLDDWKADPTPPNTLALKKLAAVKRAAQALPTFMENKVPGQKLAGWFAYDNKLTAYNVVQPSTFTKMLSGLERIVTAVAAGGGNPGTASRIKTAVQEASVNLPWDESLKQTDRLQFATVNVSWPAHPWYGNRRGIVNGHLASINLMTSRLEAMAKQVILIVQKPTTGASASELCDRVAFVESVRITSCLLNEIVRNYVANLQRLCKISVLKRK